MTGPPGPAVLLVQVRDHAAAERQEAECFSRALSISPEDLETHSVARQPRLDWGRVKDFDLLLIGGAGEHSVTREYEFSPFLDEVLARWIEDGRPFFGSCYGHHVLGRLFGGAVIEDPASEEIGTFEIDLTAAGREDPLFSGLPPTFLAQLGHHDRVSALPANLIELARSKLCTNQALKVVGKPAYSTQFHPEMGVAEMRRRLLMYRDGYLDSETADGLLGSLRSSPETGRILTRFLELYF